VSQPPAQPSASPQLQQYSATAGCGCTGGGSGGGSPLEDAGLKGASATWAITPTWSRLGNRNNVKGIKSEEERIFASEFPKVVGGRGKLRTPACHPIARS